MSCNCRGMIRLLESLLYYLADMTCGCEVSDIIGKQVPVTASRQGIPSLNQRAVYSSLKPNSMKIQNILNPSVEDTGSEDHCSMLNCALPSGTLKSTNPASTKVYPSTEMAVWNSRRSSSASILTDVDSIFSGTQAFGSGTQTSKDSTPASIQNELPPVLINHGPSIDRGHQRRSHSLEDRPNQSDNRVKKNKSRPKYDPEQKLWILFHTTDIPLNREKGVKGGLEDEFNSRWPGAERGVAGIICVLYRITKYEDLPGRRLQKAEGGGRIDLNKYGMWAVTGHRFPWMDEYADRLPGRPVL